VAEKASTSLATPALNRWHVAVSGVVMQMILGTVYAWSVFKTPLVDAMGWTNAEVGLAFTLAILFIGLSAAFGGRFVDQAGARKVATIGAVLFGAGTLLAGLAVVAQSKWLLWLGYGVIGGIGNGLGYITPVAVLVRWFPDKRGFITGLAVMGFGFGAAIMGQIAPLIIPGLGVANTFFLFGVVFLGLLLWASRGLENPPAHWVPPAAATPTAAAASARRSMTLSQALHTPQFYMLWAIMFINITAGISLISNLSPMAQAQTGLTAVTAGTLVFVTSIFNGLGRIFWAALSDRVGRRTVFIILLASQIPLLLALPGIASPWLFGVVCCYVLSCYGGGFATMPAFVADTFGTASMGNIYGKILLAWGAAGVVGPMLMEWVHNRTGNFATALYTGAGMLVIGLILALAYRPPVAEPTPAGA